jgi:oligopeptide/dipeptide ABC transporter ATP-binding protein
MRVGLWRPQTPILCSGCRRIHTPNTEALLNSVPDVSVHAERLYSIGGQPPSIYGIPAGCPFAPRSPYVMDRCRVEYPPAKEVEPGQMVPCWKYA